jgi:8-hydroxy-5-deazaflavin:NADPH oxidoreductase
MNVTVFGTGPVGRSVATRLVELTHAVAMGSRDPDNPDGQAWLATVGTHRGAKLVGLAEAAAHGALLVNATSGPASITALELAGAHNLHGKVLLDLANPDPEAVEADSLAEQIQRAFPDVKVVKALNMVAPDVMIHPDRLPEETTAFVAGEDPEAKATVADLLRSFGWRSILDLGGVRAARGMETYRLLWSALATAQGTDSFNLRVVRA